MKLPGEDPDLECECKDNDFFSGCLSIPYQTRVAVGFDRWNHEDFNICKECIQFSKYIETLKNDLALKDKITDDLSYINRYDE